MKDEDPLPGNNKYSAATNSSDSSFLKRAKNRLGRLFGLRMAPSLSEEVVDLIEEHDPEGHEVSSIERTMLSNVLKLGQMTVGDIMIPRTDIIAVSQDTSLPDLKKLIVEQEHTRIPVYQGTLDNVIGFVHGKDLLPFIGNRKDFDLSGMLRKMLFVPPSMKVLDLLFRMRDKRTHMAIVLDEYGGTDGLVTLEDVMEEIVGEIEDEHDDVEVPGIHRVDEHTYQVSARATIEALETELDVVLRADSHEEFDTLGGLIFFMLGRVPDKGENVTHSNGIKFEILDADQRRIKTVLLHIPNDKHS